MHAHLTRQHRIIRGILALACIIGTSCSLVQPDHDFPEKIPHSFDLGSGYLDTLAVVAILEANGIPTEKFSAITRTGPDRRIYSLNLGYLNIDTLPEAICSMGALEYLNLSHNYLTTLPDSIVKLRIYTPYEPPYQGGSVSTAYKNGLFIDHNRFCAMEPPVAAWIDRQFNQTMYLAKDTTQLCTATR